LKKVTQNSALSGKNVSTLSVKKREKRTNADNKKKLSLVFGVTKTQVTPEQLLEQKLKQKAEDEERAKEVAIQEMADRKVKQEEEAKA